MVEKTLLGVHTMTTEKPKLALWVSMSLNRGHDSTRRPLEREERTKFAVEEGTKKRNFGRSSGMVWPGGGVGCVGGRRGPAVGGGVAGRRGEGTPETHTHTDTTDSFLTRFFLVFFQMKSSFRTIQRHNFAAQRHDRQCSIEVVLFVAMSPLHACYRQKTVS